MSVEIPRRQVFFDLDGTLHQQDMFGSFVRFLLRRLPLNIVLLVPLLPVVGCGLLLAGRSARWPMSLLLWAMTFGHREARLQALEQQFVAEFRAALLPFPVVLQRLQDYLSSGDADVWLLTGSPQQLVEQVYHDVPFLAQVNLIGSRMIRARGGRVLSRRCLGSEKVRQLEQRLGRPLQLYSGYSDSSMDDPVLQCCQYRWRVDPRGELHPLP